MRGEKYKVDKRRTAELNQPDLQVISGKGDKDHFFCTLATAKVHPRCPYCGNPVIRNQGDLHREFLDVIPRGEDVAFITVLLEFRKSKCLAEDCGRVFYPQISFASPYARTTHRLEDALVRMILLEGYSYSEISEMFENRLSRQVVGQIFHRRVKELRADDSDKALWFRNLMAEGWHPGVWKILNRSHRLP